MEIQPAEYERLLALIFDTTGLRLNDHRHNDLARAVTIISSSLNVTSVDGLLAMLANCALDHPMWQQLVEILTVGETYFFRNRAHFNALRNHVLPALIDKRRRAGQQHLRIWSAGCATGEEPYSLAMLLSELLPDYHAWSIMILGTDINAAYLEYARQGIYRSRSFRNETPPTVQERWFTAEGSEYTLDPRIRDRVLFEQLNLVSDTYPAYDNGTMNLDLVICRNVTIYFDTETTQSIVDRFYKALIPDGWLIVGHSEPMASVYKDLVPRNFKNAVFYQKEELAVPVAPPLPPVIEPVVLPPARPPVPKRVKVRQPSPDDLWLRARQAADQEFWGQALDLLDEAERIDKFQPQVHYLRALIQLQNGMSSAAFASLRQAIYCDADFTLAHYLLGELYAQRNTYKDAVRHWHKAESSLEGMAPHDYLPFTEDLTVEMLRDLLKYRLKGGKL